MNNMLFVLGYCCFSIRSSFWPHRSPRLEIWFLATSRSPTQRAVRIKRYSCSQVELYCYKTDKKSELLREDMNGAVDLRATCVEALDEQRGEVPRRLLVAQRQLHRLHIPTNANEKY
jgi:hypothetical protein